MSVIKKKHRHIDEGNGTPRLFMGRGDSDINWNGSDGELSEANLVFRANESKSSDDTHPTEDTVEYSIIHTPVSKPSLDSTHVIDLNADENSLDSFFAGTNVHPSSCTPEEFASSVRKFKIASSNNSDKEQSRLVGPLLVRCLALALCVGVFLYSSYLVILRTVETNKAESEYESIRVDAKIESAVKKPSKLTEPGAMLTVYQMLSSKNEQSTIPPEVIPVDEMEQFKKYYQNFLSLRSKYSDMFGWIVLSETKIDYPLMLNQSDNFYYLNHSYSGQLSRSGSCYADAQTKTDYLSNRNLVTYGHSMQNGTMYRGIKLWYDSGTRDADAEKMRIYVYSADGLYIYEIFSSYRSTNPSMYARMHFSSNDDYLTWLNSVYGKSSLEKTSDYSVDSHIITMITCSNVSGNPDERYVLHGKLVSVIPASDLLG